MKHWPQIIGSSLIVFALTSGASYLLRSDGHGLPGVQDGIRRIGFPLIIWEEGGFAYRHTFSFASFMADFALAVVASVLISVLYSRVTHEHTTA